MVLLNDIQVKEHFSIIFPVKKLVDVFYDNLLTGNRTQRVSLNETRVSEIMLIFDEHSLYGIDGADQ